MKRQGYSLRRLEVLNWGNFQNWQVLELTAQSGLASATTGAAWNSLVAGVNGAGKSTIIDGIMSALLPFDQSLKLGVTHDSEGGSKGGRNIRDYVLGKYSSSGDAAVADDSLVYSRRTGASALLLVFEHNSRPNDFVSIGRAWWYADGKLREDNASFISRFELSIGSAEKVNLLDDSGRPFGNASKFRKGITAKGIQAFENLRGYFRAVCATFGDMTKDDLKLLNQAFYLKSVTNIDAFVRSYMLAEKENESMARLVSHVEVAAGISRSIEECEKRLRDINRIITELQAYKAHCEERALLQGRQKLLQIYPTWEAWRSASNEADRYAARAAEFRQKLPELNRDAQDKARQLEAVRVCLSKNKGALAIKSLENELELLERRCDELTTKREDAAKAAAKIGLKLPKTREEYSALIDQCTTAESELEKRWKALDTKKTDCAVEIREHDRKHEDIRAELQFASEHRTLIPRNLYAIKQECLRALRLPDKALMFVGELIAVRKGDEEFRRAVEAVLSPISKNLLCLPDCLEQVTRWFNKTGLRNTVTFKAIRPEEMRSRQRPQHHASSILAKIELRERKENPFYDYLWNWLASSFYHRIVSVDELKSQVDKAVTKEGLVKQDPSTRRKYKENLEYALGWDSAERALSLRRDLEATLAAKARLEKLLAAKTRELREVDEGKAALAELRKLDPECLDIERRIAEHKAIEKQIAKLKRGDKELEELCAREEALKSEADQATKAVASCEADIRRDGEDEEKRRKVALSKLEELEEALGTGESFSQGIAALEELAADIAKRAVSATAYSGKIRSRIDEIDRKKLNSPVVTYMRDYERENNDPNLNYEIKAENELPSLISQWQSARDTLMNTGLPQAKAKWEAFYSDTLIEAIKTAINDIRMEQEEIRGNVTSINEILRQTDFENLPTERRYLQLKVTLSQDDRVRQFLAEMKRVETVISGAVRTLEAASASKQTMAVLQPFVDALQQDENYRAFVVDVRNHFRFSVQSRRRSTGEAEDLVVEGFTGAARDAKSSAQTTQLAYTLLASALAYRFHFYDAVRGQNSLRLIILDEFGGKFDNEKPHDIVALLREMGFQAILISPMSKADLLAEYISQLVLVYKASASVSKVQSYPIMSREDYDHIVQGTQRELITKMKLEENAGQSEALSV